MSVSIRARAVKHFALAAFAAGLFTAAAPASADAPFSFDTAYGRLPKNVRPIGYRIAITPNIAKKTLTGTEAIDLDVRSATATIQFNTLNQTLQNVRFDGRPVLRTLTENAKQLTTVTLAAPARTGRHKLTFGYRGQIESAPVGLFAQPYLTPAGVHATLLATQFESTDARRMFPCWDEPAFRSTFDLTATVPAAFATVSNMPVVRRVVNGELATTTFARTPPMPTYLVAYVAGDFVAAAATSGGTGFKVWTINGQEAGGAYSLGIAQQILADYNAYFGHRFPLPVLNQIALPGGFQGGMENWGAITYNDQAILITPSSTLDDRRQVYSIVAHEMAHQWNGDLVTMGWWDDIWLNESFASWMSAKQTDIRNPSWLWWENQDSEKEKAMSADTRATSHAIAVHITDELQAETAFDSEITYAKGQSFLRMLEAYLGPNVFRTGIRRYIKARAFSNATATDLWRALSAASGRDVGKLASSWVTEPGFPLVAVNASCDTAGNRTIALTQKRFLLEGGDPNLYHWNVPLRVRSGLDGTIASVLMPPEGISTRAGRCGEALSVNADAVGYYRVAYDRATTAANLRAFPRLPDGDRIPLLDDQWALAASGQAPLASFLGAARSMNGDLDARAWTIITGALETIAYAERGTPGYNVYVTFASSILKPVQGRLGFDAKPGENPGLQALRRTVLADLGAWGDSDVISEAQRRFARFVHDRKAITPDDQATILGIVMLYADRATFDQMHALARSAKSDTDKLRYYSALLGVRDESLAQRAIGIVLSGEIPPQSTQSRDHWIRSVADLHPALAWSAFKANMHLILDPQGSYNAAYVIAHYGPSTYWDGAPLDELESFAKANTPDDLHADVDRSIESARGLIERKAQLRTATDAYLAK